MFRRILVAIDGSDAARAAFVFATDWARQFDARIWFIQLAEESHSRRCSLRTDVAKRGRQLANSFSVSGATRKARNQQLVSAIAEAAQTYQADLIVLGFDPRRVADDRFNRGVREQLTAATDLPVLVAPPQCAPSRVAARAEAHSSVPKPIALGPASEVPAPVPAGARRLVHV
jgi:nucleotide-binding universal stress UspA family protein